MRRFTSLLIAGAGTLAAVGTVACSHTSANSAAQLSGMPPVAVRAVKATAADVPLMAAAIGNVEAISSVDVKARVTAPVLKVQFAEGENVNRGQLLFELDPELYRRQIAEIEADIAKDVAAEKQSQANIEKDQANQKNLDTVAQRSNALLKQGIFSHEQTDQAVANADAGKASLQADVAALQSARAAEQADRARLAQTQLSLSYCKIYAPISGRAGAIQIKAGNLAKENDTTLVTLLQISPIYVTFSVPENLLPEVRKYNAQRPLEIVAIAADGSKSSGTLRFIDNSVDATTGTIKLKAQFPNAAHTLWPGQFVNVEAQLQVERGRVVVPSRAVQNGPQGKYVWVVNPGDQTAAMRTVQVLRNYSSPKTGSVEEAVIGDGLQAGETVVSEGQMRLAPGAHVRLLNPDAASAG